MKYINLLETFSVNEKIDFVAKDEAGKTDDIQVTQEGNIIYFKVPATAAKIAMSYQQYVLIAEKFGLSETF